MASWRRVFDSGPAMNGGLLHDEIRSLIAQLVPADVIEAEHCREALAWMDSTGDIFRLVAPRTPNPHLVSYFLLVDHAQGSALLADHRKAGLWLPREPAFIRQVACRRFFCRLSGAAGERHRPPGFPGEPDTPITRYGGFARPSRGAVPSAAAGGPGWLRR